MFGLAECDESSIFSLRFFATSPAISSCIAKMSLSSRSKFSDQTWKPSVALMSCAEMRTWLPAFCTLPSTTKATLSSRAMSETGTRLPLK